MDEETKKDFLPAPTDRTEYMRLDEMADMHARLSFMETQQTTLSRRVTRLEDGARGKRSDEFELFSPTFVWVAVLLTLAPIVVDLYKTWRLSQSS